MGNRVTPVRGSPTGKIIITYDDEDDKKENTHRFDDEPTVCFCGLPFHEHSAIELSYIQENNRCQRVAKKA